MRDKEVFLTINEAIALLPEGIKANRFLLYRERKKGKIPSYKFGGRIYFLKEDIEKYIEDSLQAA